MTAKSEKVVAMASVFSELDVKKEWVTIDESKILNTLKIVHKFRFWCHAHAHNYDSEIR